AQQHVEVEIEASETVHREIAEEVILLDTEPEGVEHSAVLGKLRLEESHDVVVVEEPVFELGVQQPDVRDGGPVQQREVPARPSLDDAPGNVAFHRAHTAALVDDRTQRAVNAPPHTPWARYATSCANTRPSTPQSRANHVPIRNTMAHRRF